ncbi:MAG: non-homologous end-joining DNA ligase [Nitrospiraceae bacterium]|nr:non-homologous end-joining DNA ligase [Nitrospiraceae bacterium]
MPDRARILIGGHEIELVNLGKVLFPESGITKAEFIDYYRKIAPVMLPHIKGRPISMQRFPEGIASDMFFQKQAPDYFPDWVNRVEVDLRREGVKTFITCENTETLIYLANLVCVPHVWLSRADKLRYPDRLIFDLDPPDGDFSFGTVRYSALILREILRQEGIEPFLMTTGSRGLHVVVPLDRGADFEAVRDVAGKIADRVVSLAPEHFTLEFNRSRRGRRVFIDIYRNAFGQTSVAPCSVRDRAGATVAFPIEWKDLEQEGLAVNSTTYNIRNVFERLKRRGDAWKDIAASPYSAEGLARRLKPALYR